ncbi:hypothetical protein ACS0TY_001922 [Phlomoides rotata]
MYRKNKASVKTMVPKRKNSSSPEERDNARDALFNMMEIEASIILARMSCTDPNETAAAAAASLAAKVEEVLREAEDRIAVLSLCLMSIDENYTP